MFTYPYDCSTKTVLVHRTDPKASLSKKEVLLELININNDYCNRTLTYS